MTIALPVQSLEATAHPHANHKSQGNTTCCDKLKPVFPNPFPAQCCFRNERPHLEWNSSKL